MLLGWLALTTIVGVGLDAALTGLLVGIAPVALSVGLRALIVHNPRRLPRPGPLQRLARALRLRFVDGVDGASASGEVDGVIVTIDALRPTGYRLTASRRIPLSLHLAPRRDATAERVTTGDADLDAKVAVSGERAAVRALLDRETRRLTRLLIRRAGEVRRGQLTCVLEGEQQLAEVQTFITLTQRLSRPVDAMAMGRNVLSEHLAVARLVFADMPAGVVRDALDEKLVEDGAPALVLIAATRIGPRAHPAVRRVAVNPHNEEAVRLTALEWLEAHHLAGETARACLDQPRLAATALRILEAADPPVRLERLAALSQHSHLAASIARAARPHGRAAEPVLLAVLPGADEDAGPVVIEALKTCGSTAAIMPLRALTRGPLEALALEAIEAIQGRIGEAGGALSVVDGEDGRLSEV